MFDFVQNLNKIQIKPWDGTGDYYLPFNSETYTCYTTSNVDFDTDILRYGYQSMATTVGGNDKGNSSFGKPSMHWFSSRYWPLLFNVKFMFSLEKKPKGCATGITNDQDRNTQQGR